jgi:hypothetical protein
MSGSWKQPPKFTANTFNSVMFDSKAGKFTPKIIFMTVQCIVVTGKIKGDGLLVGMGF